MEAVKPIQWLVLTGKPLVQNRYGGKAVEMLRMFLNKIIKVIACLGVEYKLLTQTLRLLSLLAAGLMSVAH